MDEFVDVVYCKKCKMLLPEDYILNHKHYVPPKTIWEDVYHYFKSKLTKDGERKE